MLTHVSEGDDHLSSPNVAIGVKRATNLALAPGRVYHERRSHGADYRSILRLSGLSAEKTSEKYIDRLFTFPNFASERSEAV